MTYLSSVSGLGDRTAVGSLQLAFGQDLLNLDESWPNWTPPLKIPSIVKC